MMILHATADRNSTIDSCHCKVSFAWRIGHRVQNMQCSPKGTWDAALFVAAAKVPNQAAAWYINGKLKQRT